MPRAWGNSRWRTPRALNGGSALTEMASCAIAGMIPRIPPSMERILIVPALLVQNYSGVQPFIVFIACSASARLAYAFSSIILMLLLGFSSTMAHELIDCCTIQYCSAANVAETNMATTTPIEVGFIMAGSPYIHSAWAWTLDPNRRIHGGAWSPHEVREQPWRWNQCPTIDRSFPVRPICVKRIAQVALDIAA